MILLGVIVIVAFLGKYAIYKGQQLEKNKRFKKNLENFNLKNK
jgi:hypothetical protein